MASSSTNNFLSRKHTEHLRPTVSLKMPEHCLAHSNLTPVEGGGVHSAALEEPPLEPLLEPLLEPVVEPMLVPLLVPAGEPVLEPLLVLQGVVWQ